MANKKFLKWEYLIQEYDSYGDEYGMDQKELNGIGEYGWELVCVSASLRTWVDWERVRHLLVNAGLLTN